MVIRTRPVGCFGILPFTEQPGAEQRERCGLRHFGIRSVIQYMQVRWREADPYRIAMRMNGCRPHIKYSPDGEVSCVEPDVILRASARIFQCLDLATKLIGFTRGRWTE